MNIVRSIATTDRALLERAFEQRCKTVYLGDHIALTRVLGDLHLYVDTRDIILAPHLLMNGCWEFWVTQAMARHLKSGMVCADVGSNVGYYTLLMAALVGEKGHVHAFDILSALTLLLRRSAEINGFGKTVTAHAHGVADREGEAPIRVPQSVWDGFSHTANAALTEAPGRGSNAGEAYQPGIVPVRPLDAIDFGERLDFVKIDVEGAEPLVWKGGVETFRRYNPVICMEWEGWRKGYAEFLALLRKDDLRVRYVEYDSNLVDLPESPDPERLYMLWVTR